MFFNRKKKVNVTRVVTADVKKTLLRFRFKDDSEIYTTWVFGSITSTGKVLYSSDVVANRMCTLNSSRDYYDVVYIHDSSEQLIYVLKKIVDCVFVEETEPHIITREITG